MKITLTGETSLTLEATTGPLTVEAPTAERSYSPFHMLASSLATCTFSVLQSWATHAGLDFADLSITVTWSFVEDPHRVGAMDLELKWPSLPEKRRASAERAANLCAVHHTLLHPPTLGVRVTA